MQLQSDFGILEIIGKAMSVRHRFKHRSIIIFFAFVLSALRRRANTVWPENYGEYIHLTLYYQFNNPEEVSAVRQAPLNLLGHL